jgi:uncharacterized protein
MNPSVAQLIEDHRGQIANVCQRYDVRCLRLFGSGLNGTWQPTKSDLDFLALYGPKRPQGLLGLVGLKVDLEELLGLPVDIVDWKATKIPAFRDGGDTGSLVIYES